jgi:primary-amine oxidase
MADAMTAHPLDPLGPEEIRQAAAILRRDQGVGARWRFASIELREPSKHVVRAWDADPPAQPCERAARVVCWNRDDGRAYKALVSLTEDAVISWAHQPDGQPNMTVDEVHECDVAMRCEPRVIEALGRRGITDMDRVMVEAWAYGAHLLPEPYSDRRLGWADVWHRSQEGSNPYANPVTGLHLVIDLNTMELLEVEDTGAIQEPATMGEYIPRLVPGLRLRDDVRPLQITQPSGPSFCAGGQPAALAEVADAGRLQLSRGARAAHGGLRGRRAGALGGAPAVLRRDGGPLPRPHLRALPPHRL